MGLSQVPESAAQRALGRLRWQDLRPFSQSAPGAMVRAAQNVAWTYGLQSAEELLVLIARPREGAVLTLRLPGAMGGSLLDPEAGSEIQPVTIDAGPWNLTTFPVPPGRTVALVLARHR